MKEVLDLPYRHPVESMLPLQDTFMKVAGNFSDKYVHSFLLLSYLYGS